MVRDVALTAPRIHVTRLSFTQFDFDDLLALIPPPDPAAKPSTTTVTLDRLTVTRGSLVARDAAVAPAPTWRIEDLDVQGSGLGTRAGVKPGRLVVRARLNGAPLALEADSVELSRTAVEARLSLEGFDLAQATPYVPSTVAVLPTGGRATLALRAKTAAPRGRCRSRSPATSGWSDLALQQRGADAPLLKVARLAVAIKEALPLAGAVTLAAIEIDGVDLSAVRDKQGQIDLLSLAAAPGERGHRRAPPPRRPPPAGPVVTAAMTQPFQVTVERLALTRARAALRDETVTPSHTLALTDISATLTTWTWPGSAPLKLDVGLNLPGAGRLTVNGTASGAVLGQRRHDPCAAPRSSRITPTAHPRRAWPGATTATAARAVAITIGRSPPRRRARAGSRGSRCATRPTAVTPLKLARLELAGIDFAWPTYARVASHHPAAPGHRVERDAAGAITLRELFTPAASCLGAGARGQGAGEEGKPPVPASTRAAGGPLGLPPRHRRVRHRGRLRAVPRPHRAAGLLRDALAGRRARGRHLQHARAPREAHHAGHPRRRRRARHQGRDRAARATSTPTSAASCATSRSPA